jgi:hypothetical protein
MHEIAGIGITVATILAATFFSNQSVNSLRTEMGSEIASLRPEMSGRIDSLRSEIVSKLDSIQRDMRGLYAEQACKNLRISNLEQHKN